MIRIVSAKTGQLKRFFCCFPDKIPSLTLQIEISIFKLKSHSRIDKKKTRKKNKWKLISKSERRKPKNINEVSKLD